MITLRHSRFWLALVLVFAMLTGTLGLGFAGSCTAAGGSSADGAVCVTSGQSGPCCCGSSAAALTTPKAARGAEAQCDCQIRPAPSLPPASLKAVAVESPTDMAAARPVSGCLSLPDVAGRRWSVTVSGCLPSLCSPPPASRAPPSA